MNSFKNAYPDIINQLSRRLDVSKIGGYLSGYTDGSLYKYSDNKVLKISDGRIVENKKVIQHKIK